MSSKMKKKCKPKQKKKKKTLNTQMFLAYFDLSASDLIACTIIGVVTQDMSLVILENINTPTPVKTASFPVFNSSSVVQNGRPCKNFKERNKQTSINNFKQKTY